MKRVRRMPTKKAGHAASQRLHDLVEGYVLVHGGSYKGAAAMYAWTLPTKYGDLSIDVHVNESGWFTVFGRWYEYKLAEAAGLVSSNGKWNFNAGCCNNGTAEEAFDYWRLQIDRLLPEGVPARHLVLRQDLEVGDLVQLDTQRPDIAYAGVNGAPIVELGPKNVKVKVDYQPAPNGPVYPQAHRIPREHVLAVQRGDKVFVVVGVGRAS